MMEDEPIIALDLEEILAEAGFDEIRVFSSCTDANGWLELNTPEVGILDPQVRDGVCTSVAKTLVERAVPFVVYSGQSADLTEDAAAIFSKGILLLKPCHPDMLLTALAKSGLRAG